MKTVLENVSDCPMSLSLLFATLRNVNARRSIRRGPVCELLSARRAAQKSIAQSQKITVSPELAPIAFLYRALRICVAPRCVATLVSSRATAAEISIFTGFRALGALKRKYRKSFPCLEMNIPRAGG
jgi:hypothetical protein